MSHESQIKLLKELEHQLGVEGGHCLDQISRYEQYIMEERTKRQHLTERARAVRESISTFQALDAANLSLHFHMPKGA